jgi:hypothetical protein
MKYLFLACFALITLSVSAQTKKVSDIAKFNSMTVDLGKVKVGTPVTGTFVVTNISNAPIVIQDVQPSCGCTKSDYTKEPIQPGKSGTITATYNAAAIGNFNKSVYVKFADINEQIALNIVGTVQAATPTPASGSVKTN